MPNQWNDSTNYQLLLAIIHLTTPQLPKWDQVAAMMGDGFTAESVRQHFQKLRKDCKAKFGEPEGETKKATPRKPRASASNGGTPTSASKKRKARAEADAEDDDEGDGNDAGEACEGSAKKVKTEEKEASV